MKDYQFPFEVIKPTGNEEHGELWEVSYAGMKIQGPYKASDLKDYFFSLESLDKALMLRPFGEEEFKAVYEWSEFSRRKPSLQTIQTPVEEDNHYHLLLNGHKTGPFKKEEIISKLKVKEISHTDLLSVDKGHTWKKAYEFSAFDRRAEEKALELPPSIVHDVLQKEQNMAMERVEKEQSTRRHLGDIAPFSRHKEESFVRENLVETQIVLPKFTTKKLIAIGFVFVLMLIGSFVGLTKSAKQDLDEDYYAEQQQKRANRSKFDRKPASDPSKGYRPYDKARSPQSLNQNSMDHNVPVPITDYNPLQYDNPPEVHEMAEAQESVVPPEPPSDSSPETEVAAPDEVQAALPDQASGAPREPASDEGGAPDSSPAPQEEQIFNQEAES